ncbi:hypothetical protein RO179_000765 [Escherichia coli]|nr:hypothetical protein [Escherichia coli]
MHDYFDRLFCTQSCNDYKFTPGEGYSIHRLQNSVHDPMVFVVADNEGTLYQVFYCGKLEDALVKNISGQWLAQFSRFPGEQVLSQHEVTTDATS